MPGKYAILGGETLTQIRDEMLPQNRNFEWGLKQKMKIKNKK